MTGKLEDFFVKSMLNMQQGFYYIINVSYSSLRYDEIVLIMTNVYTLAYNLIILNKIYGLVLRLPNPLRIG